jgi:hypothetical protein
MVKKIGFFLILSLIAIVLFYIYDTFFSPPRWEWPTIFIALFFPFSIFCYNIFGFIISLIFLKKKLHLTIAYVLFIINLFFSLGKMELIYNFTRNIEILKRINNYDMARLNHNGASFFSNTISILLILSLIIMIRILRIFYFKILIESNNKILTKILLNMNKNDIEKYLENIKDKTKKEKYSERIGQQIEKNNSIKE